MRVFLLGDFYSDNGPGNANKQVLNSLTLKFDISYSRATGKFERVLEMYRDILRTDMLLICSASKINYLAVRLAKSHKKKIIYLMHGYSSYEERIEHPERSDADLEDIIKYEKFIFASVDKIVCVSKRCMVYMKSTLQQYEDKFDYVYNVVDIDRIEEIYKETAVDRKKQILSLGGGMKRKNIYSVVAASPNVKVVVVGKSLSDGDRIKSCDNVLWYEHLSHGEVFKLMAESSLYIQNSIFETFGLAIIEALFSGCSILVSNAVGCLDLFDNLLDQDIIYDVFDQNEMANKIEFLLSHPNNERLIKGFNRKMVSKEWQANRWQEIIEGLTSNEYKSEM